MEKAPAFCTEICVAPTATLPVTCVRTEFSVLAPDRVRGPSRPEPQYQS